MEEANGDIRAIQGGVRPPSCVVIYIETEVSVHNLRDVNYMSIMLESLLIKDVDIYYLLLFL